VDLTKVEPNSSTGLTRKKLVGFGIYRHCILVSPKIGENPRKWGEIAQKWGEIAENGRKSPKKAENRRKIGGK
jgi:hypothetical protein